jgi:hypothetical protein
MASEWDNHGKRIRMVGKKTMDLGHLGPGPMENGAVGHLMSQWTMGEKL